MPQFSWRNQTVTIAGKTFTCDQMVPEWEDVPFGLLYHGSPYKLNIGDILKPGINPPNFKDSRSVVSLTSAPARALHWALKANKGSVAYVYTVEPLGPLEFWRVSLGHAGTKFIAWEITCASAIIIDIAESPKYNKKSNTTAALG